MTPPMFGLNVRKMKEGFFDRAAVTLATDKATLRVLSRFGATDLLPDFGRLDLRRSRLFNNRILRALPCWEGSIALLESLLGRILPISSDFYYYDLEKLHIRACEFVERQAEIGGALPLTAFEASLCGNPEDLVRYKGRNYTMPMLYYYLRYVYCCRFVDFSKIDVLVELGSGSGKQIEILPGIAGKNYSGTLALTER